MKASIVDLRYRMKDVLRAIDRGETVTVLYRGKEKARILPLEAKQETLRVQDTPFFGMWKDREDMADPAAYVRKIREPRYAELWKGLYAEQDAKKAKKRVRRAPPAGAKNRPRTRRAASPKSR